MIFFYMACLHVWAGVVTGLTTSMTTSKGVHMNLNVLDLHPDLHAGNKECGEEEEFRMYSSQTYNYVRRSSQADAEQQEEDEEPATTHWDVPSSWGAGTQAAGVTQPVQPVTQAHSDLVTQDLCGLTQVCFRGKEVVQLWS